MLVILFSLYACEWNYVELREIPRDSNYRRGWDDILEAGAIVND